MTLYRHGTALVFGAGTVQWSWGLDANHDYVAQPASLDMQQATVNLFADMTVQPGSLAPGLTLASPSLDNTAPVSTIQSPSGGATLVTGGPVTISGISTDTTGMVGGVEISVDGGATWRAASGRESWTYDWTPSAPGTVVIKVRASDDSGNLETPGAGTSVEVVGSSVFSIWEMATVPAVLNDTDPTPVELGVKFRSQVNGYITGVRFYKGLQNVGPHVGHLWSLTGTQLAAATFSNETAEVAAGDLRVACTDHRQHDLRRVVPYIVGSWFVRSSVLRWLRSRESAAGGPRHRRGRRQRSVRGRVSAGSFPETVRSRPRTIGSMSSSRRRS